ncbi:MAG: hypothetical protein DIZ80_00500 [endosymbiont of Galathealinum brachiosum]|uniref:Sel1 repeat family protein n=1 Tax=endosymbiont of Galathealinum brachiosum TaxID=2200906 RepID=A0A370DPB7_9GAMM|nr:MAG: hypothetical protein DIZ80_00500 [endosymbiont of Galathealinum brachiosum]
MKIMKIQTVSFFIKCLSILLVSVSTSFATNYDIKVFEFQQKLANGGDAQAQYRLAGMYETGRGVAKDNSLAMTWYKKSSSNNNPAANRYLKYIDIKKTGFKASDKAWLKTVYTDAKNGDESALLILGKLHENGTGVKRSLKKSKRYFKLAFNRGDSDAEAHVNRVERKIFAKKEKQKKKTQLVELNKEEEKEIKQAKDKKQPQKKAAKTKAPKSTPNKQLANNKSELKRLEAERNKIARERKELETMKKDMAEAKAVKAKTADKEPVKNKTIASNEAYETSSHANDMCSGKAARFMSRCK